MARTRGVFCFRRKTVFFYRLFSFLMRRTEGIAGIHFPTIKIFSWEENPERLLLVIVTFFFGIDIMIRSGRFMSAYSFNESR